GASRVRARLWCAAPVGRIRSVWSRGVCRGGDGGEHGRLSGTSSPWMAAPRAWEWPPRRCAAGLPLAPLVGVCRTPRISGRSGGESWTCPSSVVHGEAQQHGPTAVRGGIKSLKQADRHARRHDGMCGEEHVMQEPQRQRRHIAERLSSAGLRPQEDTVRKAILMAFADTGKAPSVQALAHALGLPLSLVLAACRTLAAADLIVWE